MTLADHLAIQKAQEREAENLQTALRKSRLQTMNRNQRLELEGEDDEYKPND